MARRRQILGLDPDLLVIVLVWIALASVLVFCTSCGLFSSAQEAADRAGKAAERIGQSVKEVSSTINWAITAIVGYVLGELRRPMTKLAGKVINGRKNGSACSSSDSVRGK